MNTYAITGASNGMGLATANRLREQGERVITVDLEDADIEVDLSTAEGREEAAQGIKATAENGLDGLILCAGVGPQTTPATLIPSVNFFGVTELVDVLKAELIRKSGSIVVIGSNSAPTNTTPEYVELLLQGDEQAARASAAELTGMELYSGSKRAIHRWLRRLAPELAASGLRLNAVAPGYTTTNMTTQNLDDSQKAQLDEFRESIPIGRAGTPEDQADAVSFLLSDAASFICGSVLYVDGGHDALFYPDKV